MNTAGNCAGVLGPLTAGIIVARTGDWALPFYLVATLGVGCGLMLFFLVSPKPVTIVDVSSVAALRKATD
jgi:MFS family permease